MVWWRWTLHPCRLYLYIVVCVCTSSTSTITVKKIFWKWMNDVLIVPNQHTSLGSKSNLWFFRSSVLSSFVSIMYVYVINWSKSWAGDPDLKSYADAGPCMHTYRAYMRSLHGPSLEPTPTDDKREAIFVRWIASAFVLQASNHKACSGYLLLQSIYALYYISFFSNYKWWYPRL